MPLGIPQLLSRNLHEVFGEGDSVKRRSVITEIFCDDAVFYAPDGVYRGHDAIHRVAGEIRRMHPEYRYVEVGRAESLHGAAGRLHWVAGRPGDPPTYAGTDFIVARNGRISAVYLFFDPLPVELPSASDREAT